MIKPFNRYKACINEQQRKRTLAIWEMMKELCDDEDRRGNREEEGKRVKECSHSRDD